MKYVIYVALTICLHSPFEGFALLPMIPMKEEPVVQVSTK